MAKASRSFNFAEALNQYYSGMSTEPSIIDDCFASTVETLARKAQTVFQTGRHNWVKKQPYSFDRFKQLARIRDGVKFLCYGLETSHKQIKCGVKCISGDNSDVDIVYNHTNGVEVRAECVFVNTSKNYLIRAVLPGTHHTVTEIGYHGNGDQLDRTGTKRASGNISANRQD